MVAAIERILLLGPPVRKFVGVAPKSAGQSQCIVKSHIANVILTTLVTAYDCLRYACLLG